jgi:hypothetical protein
MGNIDSCDKKINHLERKLRKLQLKNKQLNDQITRVNNLRDNNDRFFYKQNETQNAGLQSVLNLVSNKETPPEMKKGRTITHHNLTDIDLDLYVTVGGYNPEPLTKITTLNKNGGIHVFNILDYIDTKAVGYNASYNFNVLPKGDKVPKYNAGPTLAEFGTNQIWASSVPDLRDTFDISCVPAGIGNLSCNNGQPCRNKAIELSKNAGYTEQQAYNYNVGCQIIPPDGTKIPSGNLETVHINEPTAPYSSNAIGYPNDTAVPKQQTGSATLESAGNYIVKWTGPIVSLGKYE